MIRGKSLTFVSLFEMIDRVEIPIVQRDYAQGRESANEVREQFIESLKEALMAEISEAWEPLDLDFIYGNFESGSENIFLVLDGQQRLTTLFLLHWYLSLNDGLHDDFLRRWVVGEKSKFTYATRPSSSEFFSALALNKIESSHNESMSLSKKIIDAHWFFLSWLYDPTIKSCLVMLDAIERSFSNYRGLYKRLLDSEKPPITFQYLNLEDFGLSDELYIKMNARGIALSDFENFKAWLFGYIRDYKEAQSFESAMDREWTDIFWMLSSHDTKSFDTLFLSFFHLMALYEACEREESLSHLKQNNFNWIRELRQGGDHISVRKFKQQGSFSAPLISRIFKLMQCLEKPKADNLRRLLKNVLSDSGYVNQAKFYSLILFINQTEAPDPASRLFIERLKRWSRLTNNLINNSRIDELVPFVAAIRSLKQLSIICDDVYNKLSNMEPSEISFFREQGGEEITKAKLILQDPIWEPLLFEFEQHEYLKGKVGFLLNYSKNEDGIYDQDIFRAYALKASSLLDKTILESPDFLLQRALLSVGDYMLEQSANRYSFGLPNNTLYRERNENWLKIVEKRCFKELLDLIHGDVFSSLNKIISETKIDGWRRLFVNYPQAIAYCGNRLIYRAGSYVLLMSKTRLSGFHSELRTYCLYIQLRKEIEENRVPTYLKNIKYSPVYDDSSPSLKITCSDNVSYKIEYKNDVFYVYTVNIQTETCNHLLDYLSSILLDKQYEALMAPDHDSSSILRI